MIISIRPTVRRSLQGFTLLELSIVLLVLSLMVAGIMTIMTQTARTERTNDLKKKMDAIEDALIAFRKENGRIPCPADGTTLSNEQYFGMESTSLGVCTGGTPTANFSYAAGHTAGGVVPTKTLGLPDQDMFDPWGGRFTYLVDVRATNTNAFTTTYHVNNTTIGAIIVQDANGNQRTAQAIAAVISHGPNGHGAYQLSGVRKSSSSTNSNEQLNCHCNSATPPVTGGTNPFTNVIVMQPYSTDPTDTRNSFDDTVRYYTRPMLSSSSDLLTETR